MFKIVNDIIEVLFFNLNELTSVYCLAKKEQFFLKSQLVRDFATGYQILQIYYK